jgi:hypothetical protein
MDRKRKLTKKQKAAIAAEFKANTAALRASLKKAREENNNVHDVDDRVDQDLAKGNHD